MSMGEEYLNDSAYEREQALEEWERESIEEEQIKGYDNKQREIARLLNVRQRWKLQMRQMWKD